MAITTHTPRLTRTELWHELAQQLRADSIRATAVSGSGHPTSSMSAADLIAVLAEKYLRYDFEHPDHPLHAVRLAVHDLPGSGAPVELLHAAGIDADAISEAVRSLVDPVTGR